MSTSPQVPPLFDLVVVDKTDSARAYAERLARVNAPDGTLVWARSQQEGLGRHGNYWMSGSRNLHCSILLRPDAPYAECCQLALLASVACSMAIAQQAEPLVELRYRWPNDVLLNRGKVAGVTLSGHREGDIVPWMVVNLNVNVNDHPAVKGFDAASMRGEGFEEYDRDKLLAAYAREFLSWVTRWDDEGFAPLRRAWLARGGEETDTAVSIPGSTVSGKFRDLDKNGNLLISTGSGTRRLLLTDFFVPDFD